MEFLGAPELLVVLVLVLLLFGPAKLPKVARSVGEAAKELRDAMTGTAGDVSPPGQGPGEGSPDVSPTGPDKSRDKSEPGGNR